MCPDGFRKITVTAENCLCFIPGSAYIGCTCDSQVFIHSGAEGGHLHLHISHTYQLLDCCIISQLRSGIYHHLQGIVSRLNVICKFLGIDIRRRPLCPVVAELQ